MVAVAEMLRGEKSARMEKFGFDQLSTFGLLSNRSQTFIVAMLRALLAAGWIDLTPTEHPVPYLTDAGWKVMKGDGPIRMRLPTEAAKAKKQRRERRPAKESAAPEGVDLGLFEALRLHRSDIAREKRVPAYVIAPDATLQQIAARKPRDDGELLAVPGMGPYRVEAYGGGLLDVVRRHLG
jgi:ATP-dependent DNA helicase RecQ